MKISLGFFSTLTLIFITLRLLGIITWGWAWVLSPMWIPTVLIIFASIIALLIIKKADAKELKDGKK